MAASTHHHTDYNLDERYTFLPETRKRVFMTIGIGLLLFIAGILLLAFLPHETHEAAEHGAEVRGGEEHGFHWITRVWANLWLNNVFFTGIAAMGIFFVAVQYVAYAGWSASIKRIPETFAYFLPITGVMMLILFFLGGHDLFHWTHDYLYNPTLENGQPNPEYDEIIAGKRGYLNSPFFVIRTIVYFAVWFGLFWMIRKQSLAEDLDPNLEYYRKSKFWSALFIVFFAVTSSTSAWDWVMSVETHWFSTMFGWYVFASWWVSALATITLVTVLLKERGLLPMVNQNHLHDLGKFMFGFSIFWTYIWFAQFLLIYYANIPEETIYFIERLHGYNNQYTGLFFLNLFINFLFPFLVLMTRDAKRQFIFLKVVSSVLLVGHWLDFYMMIMPGSVGANGGFGLVEFGAVAMYAGAFILVVSTVLGRTGLVAKHHPMLQESIHHEI